MPFVSLNERYPVKCAAFIRDPVLKYLRFDKKIIYFSYRTYVMQPLLSYIKPYCATSRQPWVWQLVLVYAFSVYIRNKLSQQ
ncbi:Uncharacterised protein [Legionella lansingensis]|uniref:Uncharacterized protein n=1 Tax=Legionella lansingensis TaxID=45067 RepID=A0A0W0VLB7_9GAMM|nr:hypothetical protein Llan_1663 [Legionella lansingensis]SNV44366.1 Uncharacterised protein [Legionella lansingensis]